MEKEKLPKGVRFTKGGYEARAMINGTRISVRNKDLEKLLEEFEAEKNRIRHDITNLTGNVTLDEWFEKWFDHVQVKKIKETSISPMKNSYKRNFGFYIGSKKIKDIRPIDIQGAINALAKEGRVNSNTRDALGRLSKCFEYAIANQMITHNPCLLVEVPWEFKATKEETALTQEEQNQFLMAVETSWYKELFYFMLLTGVRVGEMGGLRWRDVDFKRKVIKIRHSLCCQYENGKKTIMLTSPKTVNSVREIPFMGEMEEILKSQKKKQARQRANYGERWRSSGEFDDLVFTTSLGSPCARYIVQKEINKTIERMDMEEAAAAMEDGRKPEKFRYFHPHTLRHTFATRCYENGIEPKVAQKLLGHSSISITLNIYTHVMESRMEEEIQKFGNANTETDPEKYNQLIGVAKPISVHSNY